jgi:hypothetical protein
VCCFPTEKLIEAPLQIVFVGGKRGGRAGLFLYMPRKEREREREQEKEAAGALHHAIAVASRNSISVAECRECCRVDRKACKAGGVVVGYARD